MEIVGTFEEARRLQVGSVGLVPTLGFVHEGHLSLIARARQECDHVLVSLFVNPLQFGPDEDFAAYPRHLDRDAGLIEAAGADLLFAPSLREMYPVPAVTRVLVPELAERMEGASRPGHFDGVSTVVAKLLAGLQPARAYFGRKDAQQLAIIARMVFDLSMPTTVVGCPTVREADGVALSSRNTYLAPDERVTARLLSRGLMAAADLIEDGERSGAVLEGRVREAAGEFAFEYVEMADQASASRLETLDRPAFLAVAGRVGNARLIDNIHIDTEEGRFVPDRGERLTTPSVLYEADRR